jgi:hypothetical protein
MSPTPPAILPAPSSCRSGEKLEFLGSGQGLVHNRFRASNCNFPIRKAPYAPTPLHRHWKAGRRSPSPPGLRPSSHRGGDFGVTVRSSTCRVAKNTPAKVQECMSRRAQTTWVWAKVEVPWSWERGRPRNGGGVWGPPPSPL